MIQVNQYSYQFMSHTYFVIIAMYLPKKDKINLFKNAIKNNLPCTHDFWNQNMFFLLKLRLSLRRGIGIELNAIDLISL